MGERGLPKKILTGGSSFRDKTRRVLSQAAVMLSQGNVGFMVLGLPRERMYKQVSVTMLLEKHRRRMSRYIGTEKPLNF